MKHLVELHGGTVDAPRSDGENKARRSPCAYLLGHDGRASIPAVSEARPSRRSSIHVPENVRGQRILVVDDDRDATELLAELLSSSDVVPLVASSAAEALEVLVRERPDVLVSDIGMPVEDGYHADREDPEGSRTPRSSGDPGDGADGLRAQRGAFESAVERLRPPPAEARRPERALRRPRLDDRRPPPPGVVAARFTVCRDPARKALDIANARPMNLPSPETACQVSSVGRAGD